MKQCKIKGSNATWFDNKNKEFMMLVNLFSKKNKKIENWVFLNQKQFNITLTRQIINKMKKIEPERTQFGHKNNEEDKNC